MGKKYMSMQEELAARKRAVGIDPEESTYRMTNRKEPKKEALSDKIRNLMNRDLRKDEGHKWKPSTSSESKKPESEETVLTELMTTADVQETEENEGVGLKLSTVIPMILGVIVIVIGIGQFGMGDSDHEEDFTDWTDYYNFTAESTDKEIMEKVDEELEDNEPVDKAQLSRWIQEGNVGDQVDDDIIFWHAEQGDKYITFTAHFEEENVDEIIDICQGTSLRLQDAVLNADMDESPAIVFIARSREDESLLLLMVDEEIYYKNEGDGA